MRCEVRSIIPADTHQSRLLCPLLVLVLLLQASGAQAGGEGSCGRCGGPCGKIGTCVLSGTLCICSDGGGACGPPVCDSALCPPTQACNPATCMCGPPGTPSATPSATPTTTPGGPCGSCAGSCGATGFGICVPSGNTCVCSGDTGGCGPPICTSTLCALGQTCNQTSCTCEEVAPTPTATPPATPSLTPPGINPVPALSPPMIGVSILALALVALLARRRFVRR